MNQDDLTKPNFSAGRPLDKRSMRNYQDAAILAYIAVINALLYILIGPLIGGFARFGEVTAGRYYLGRGYDFVVEVAPWVFTYSLLHEASVVIGAILAALAIPVSWIANKRSAQGDTPDQTSRLWVLYDLVEGGFWLLLDAWRKPAIEFFTRLPRRECIERLRRMSDPSTSPYRSGKPLAVDVGRTHFYLSKPVTSKQFALAGLLGKLSPTPQGTYVRAWYRFATIGTLLITVILSGMLVTLLYLVVFIINPQADSQQIVELLKGIPLPRGLFAVTLGLLISIRLGAWWAHRNNVGLTAFLKERLVHRQETVERTNQGGLPARLKRN